MELNGAEDNSLQQIKMRAIPLILHDNRLKQDNTKECVLDTTSADTQECSVYVNGEFDYDIRIENIGQTMADINVYTVELPTNQLAPVNLIEYDGPCPYLTEIYGYDTDVPPPPPRPNQRAMASMIVTAIITISLIALFMIRRISKRRRQADAHSAYVDSDGEIIVEERCDGGGVYTKMMTDDEET
eukprot:308272_1